MERSPKCVIADRWFSAGAAEWIVGLICRPPKDVIAQPWRVPGQGISIRLSLPFHKYLEDFSSIGLIATGSSAVWDDGPVDTGKAFDDGLLFFNGARLHLTV